MLGYVVDVFRIVFDIYNAYGASPPPLAFSDFDLTPREEKVLTVF